MENEERSMETVKAGIATHDEMHFIEISVAGGTVSIPISDDRPNEVKSAFNKLIVRLKDGPFTIVLENVGEDLFSQVSVEYISQLNREIQEVYNEMKELGLVKV